MKKLIPTLPLLLCVLALGCDRGNDANFYINPDEVSHILFTEDWSFKNMDPFSDSEDAVDGRREHGEIFRITNRDEILEFARVFNDLRKQPEGAVTFSGTFGGLWFMSGDNTALADTILILNGMSCVVVSMGSNFVEEDGRFWSVARDYDPAFNMAASCPKYAATVFKAVKKYAPAEIERASKFVEGRNASLEDALGIQNQSSP